jgi:signal transduction histidine kinase
MQCPGLTSVLIYLILLGEPMSDQRRINKNCALSRNLGIKLYNRCDYCHHRFVDCIGTQYNIVIMITFAVLLVLPHVTDQPVFQKVGTIGIVLFLLMLGIFVNTKTDALYRSEYELKAKTLEMEKLNSELTQLNRSLSLRSAELTQANEELRKLDKIKSDFLSTVSHEFRSPLTSIKAFADILLNNKETMTPTESDEFVTIIEEEADRLTRMVTDLLDLTKLESGTLEWKLEPVRLDNVIAKAATTISAVCREKKIQVTIPPENTLPMVMGDFDRLIQVVTNLLDNAVKFTKEGGHITVEAQTSAGDVTVFIHDTGAGIPEDQTVEIFDKFKQGGDTLTDKPRGTGLGLPICKDIVEALGGTIWVEQRKEPGAIFAFRLPATRPAPLPEASACAEWAGG